MPELPICIHCNQPINEAEAFVITNKQAPKDVWQYAHAECYAQETTQDSSSAA